MTGRPSDYSEETAAKLCEQLAQGISLRTACKADDMPAMATVYLWLGRHPLFVEQYTRAKSDAADAMSEDILDISDDATIASDHKRIMVDSRKWLASKLKPKRYGDKLALGGDTEAGPIQVTWAQPKPLQITED